MRRSTQVAPERQPAGRAPPYVMVVFVAEWDELQETIAVLSDPPRRAD
ncbi:MAG TPA: hypothetical protein VFX70_17000 [Mycobacteriales bacterium]|nr:hypothetical protein [Mycobacteriales bacterium]